MECSERILCGTGEVELDPNIVSEEAGKLYSELQTVVETHGEGVVESLVPTLVWVLEGLASCKFQLREKEEEAESEKAEREQLLERYQAEKALRKESQERYLELDDQIEQERRAIKGREKERERRERELERKAREQADQLVALEEQKANLSRELSTLRHTHNKLSHSHRELLEKRKDSERESLLRNHVRFRNADFPSQVSSESKFNEKNIQRPHSNSGPPCFEDLAIKEEKVNDINKNRAVDAFVSDIISSTPELIQFHDHVKESTPIKTSTDAPLKELESSLEEERKKVEELKVEEKKEEEVEKKDQEVDEDDSMEWDLRNTDSVFSELSELSRDYVESVDQGANVRGGTDQFEEILAQFEDLKVAHESVEAARKALISRVVELTDDRAALILEVATLQETVERLEGRLKERDEEIRRVRKELESCQSEDPDASLSTSMRHFSRSEMARVVMEKNQYKQRLFELQEAVRHSQTLRATKEEKFTEEKQSSVWRNVSFAAANIVRLTPMVASLPLFIRGQQRTLSPSAARSPLSDDAVPSAIQRVNSIVSVRFNRLFGLTKVPLVPPSASSLVQQTSPAFNRPPLGTPQPPLISQSQSESASSTVISPRLRRKELYREIRSQIWGILGKRQIHGWSVLLASTQEAGEPIPEPKDVPVLVQLRLLDQRDSTAKINCAAAVPPETSGEASCSVWVISGPASCSDITVIDPARSNTVLDQFSLPPTAPALCMCAVPPIDNSSGTVWIGTQEGSILIHSASANRRCCLQSACLSEGVHSLMYSDGQVVAGLGDGTLAFFSHTSDGWNLQSHTVMALGANPLQPVRCCLAKSGRLWVGYWNKVHVVDMDSRKVEQIFSVSERGEQQVRFLCAAGSGVWASCRLDPVIRLFDWSTGRPLQEVDLTSLITKTLGQPFLSLSPLQISSLTIISGRLWVGTGGGAIFSIPLSITSEDISIPYCSTASTQLSYHGHRQAVRFIIAAPGCLITSPGSSQVTPAQLVLSGGEGYINFRIGDDGSDESIEVSQASPQRSERSHLIIWQTPSVPSPAL